MNFNWFAKVIQKVGSTNRSRVKNKLRSNSRGMVRQFLRGFERLEDRRVLAAYDLVGGAAQLTLAANEALTVTTASNEYTFTLASGSWSGPGLGGFFGAGTNVLKVSDTPPVSILDGGAGTSVTFDTSVAYIASFTVALTNAAAGSITFAAPTNFVDTFGTTTFSVSTTRNIVVNAGISTQAGNLTLAANQQATATTGTFVGVDLNNATVRTTGAGALSISGKGGSTGNGNFGVQVRAAALVETTGSGSVTINGAAGSLADTTAFGIQLTGAGSTVRKNTGSGSITLIGDTIDIGASTVVNAGTVNSVNVRPRTNLVAINVGGNDVRATPVLGLTDAELDLIAAASVNIGNASSGPISVSAVISPASYKTLALGNNTTFGATSGFISDVGPTLATFEKIAVTGTVAITAGATFTPVAAGYVPVLLDSFRFLDNDLTDGITGAFTLPSLVNFLGSAFTASESYAAGTGNDFVIAVPKNNAPTFNVGANQLVNQDSGAQTIVGWASGITAGGDPLPVQTLTFTTSGFNASLFLVAPAVSPTTGTLTYTPNPATFGTTTVTLTLQDSGGTLNGGVDTTTKTFIIRVNALPIAVNDVGATTELGTTTGNVLSNDSDPDTGETATLVVAVPGTLNGTFGTLTLAANGNYSYTANANQLTVGQTVTDSFAYRAKDVNAALSNVASLVITITGENDAPVAVNNSGATTELGTTTGSGSVLSNDTDPDTGETATLVVDVPGTVVGTFGTLTLAANGTFSYTANANQLKVGQIVTDNFPYQARDVNGALSNVATLAITITGENDAPVAVDDFAATTELGTTTGSGSVLSNDTDPDTGETATLVVNTPGTTVGTFGTLTLAANGTYSYTANANQLTVGQQVTEIFTYRAKDVNNVLSNVGTLVITITGENDAPVAVNDVGGATELGTTTGSVLSNDTDSDTGETATLVVEVPGTITTANGVLTLAANGTYSYTANANQLKVGQTVTDSFAYKAKDVNGALSNVATLTITITGENDAPVAVNDSAATTETGTTTGSGSVLSNDTDADTGEAATLVVNTPGTVVGTFGTLILAANGTFSYTANANQLAAGQTVTDTFTYQAKDVNGALSNIATLTITVTGENDAPTAVGFTLPGSVNEGVAATATITSVSDVDVPDTFTYNYVLKKNGVAVQTSGFISGTTSNLTPDDGGLGIVWTVEVQAKDAAGAVSPVNTQTLTVNNVAPVLTRLNASLSGGVGTLFTNTGTYSDVPADTVTLSADIGDIVNNGNGTWSWSRTPTAPVTNQVITITATDEDGSSSSVTFTLTALDITPPTIGSVKVAGTLWAPAFKGVVDPVDGDNSDGSDGIGFQIPTDTQANQLKPLPWSTVNTIVLAFSEPVTGVNLANIDVAGVNKVNYKDAGGPQLVGVDYNSTTNEATLSFNGSLTRDKLLIKIGSGSVQDLAGNTLGAYSFRLNVLPGDTNQSVAVNQLDVNAIKSQLGFSTGTAGFNPMRDLNGSGAVNQIDVNTAKNNLGGQLPPADPT